MMDDHSLRKRFFGDTEAARLYAPQAVKLLGFVKHQMGYHGLSQLSRQVILAGGVVLFASCVFGQDEITVYVPEAKAEPVQAAAERASYTPYLWIGVRIANRTTDASHEVHACLWEPGIDGAAPQILSNRNDFIGFDNAPGGEYPLGSWPQYTPGNFGIAYTDAHLFMLGSGCGYPMRVPDYAPGVDRDVEWDVIFISDPGNDLQLSDAKGNPMAGTGTGTYYLKVMVTGPDCPANAGMHYPPQPGVPYDPVDVEIMVITGKNESRREARHQVTISEFTVCPQGIVPFGYFPKHRRGNPGGSHPDHCYGANPHGPHWWQGMATIALPPLQVDVLPEQLVSAAVVFSADGKVELPPTGFAPGPWPDMCEYHPTIVYQRPFKRGSCDFRFPSTQTYANDTPPGHTDGISTLTVSMQVLRQTTISTFTQFYLQFWEHGGYGAITPTFQEGTGTTVSDWEVVFDRTITWQEPSITGINIGPTPSWVGEAEDDWLHNHEFCDAPGGEVPTGPMEMVPY